MRLRFFAVFLACVVCAPGVRALAVPPNQEAPANADTLVRHVRVQLGRGSVGAARRLAESVTAPAPVKAVAIALVEIFEGKDAAARARLTPLVEAGDQQDALLELGLMDLRQGRRPEGLKRLEVLLQQTYDMTPENSFRMAKAAAATGDIRLANTIFQRIGTIPLQQADMEATWGDMLLEKHQVTDAVRSYGAALEADNTWIRAKLGLSRALADENVGASDAALEHARSLAPAHPDVWLLTAERRLVADDKAGTAQALDLLAAARPGTAEEAALRAALAYADRRPADVDAALARALAINPQFSAGYRTLGQQAARTYRFADAAAYARQAVKLDDEDSASHADLGLHLMRTGDEKEARVELERAFRLDPFDTVTYNLLQLLDTLDGFEAVPSGEFVFKFAKEEAAVLKTYALPLADLAYKTFSERYGIAPKGPILVELFSKHDDFAVRTLGLPGIVGALGACFGKVVTMDSPRARPPGSFSWQATLWHEIAHVFSLQASDHRVPRWLTEGISVFEEHRHNKAWGRELALEFASALSKGQTFGVRKLPQAFQRPQSITLAYFEASLLTEHLVSLSGDAGLRALLAAYAGGSTDEQAFTKAFGKTTDQIEASFKAFVESEYGALKAAMTEPPPPPGAAPKADAPVPPPTLEMLRARAAAAPGSFVAQWSLGVALHEASEFAEARGPLERAAVLAPMASGGNSPRALLADLAMRDGDRAKAMRELRELLTWDHDNIEAARRLVVLAEEAKDDEVLAFALRIVADTDPYDVDAHVRLGRRALGRKEFAAALTELSAVLALGPPNLAEAHADLAEAYLGLGRKDDAKRSALKALEQAPTFARAQDLLLAAIGKQQ